MKKMFQLIRIQLWAVLSDTLSIGSSRRKKPKVLYVGVLLFILLMSAVSFLYNYVMGLGLRSFDSLHVLPALMMSATCIITLFTTIFKVKGTIFGFRDYDMIMSLPVSTGAIVVSRLIILYTINFIFVIILMVPMMVAYGLLSNANLIFYLISAITIFFIPLVPIVIASFLGTAIAYLASKFKRSNALNIVFSLGLLMIILGLSFVFDDNGEELVNVAKLLTDQINTMYPLAQMYTEAVVDQNIRSLLLFILISVAAFLLYTVLVQKIFKRMNTLIMTGRTGSNFKMKELKTSSPWKALYVKELKRYFSSTIYVTNTGFGIVMLTLAAIAMIFVDPKTLLSSPGINVDINGYVPIFITFCIAMSNTTMASLSLEGRNLWIVKSMPVAPMTVFLSKVLVNLTIISPAILDVILIGILLDFEWPLTVVLVAMIIALGVLISFFGLIVNLLLPNFNWSSEVIVVKQSAASMVAIFSGMGYTGLIVVFLATLPNITVAYGGFLLLTLVLDVLLYLVLRSYGQKRFYKL